MCSSSDLLYVLNLANSIMGVSLLAMPFCFMKCGIILGSILLMLSTFLTIVSCEILMRSAIAAKKRSYEFLAMQVFGGLGKFAVEVGVAGVQIGICIAFHVIIGDLGPSLISKWTGWQNDSNLRLTVMLMACCVSLPLSMMKKLDSLHKLSAGSITFYGLVVLTVVMDSLPNIISGEWTKDVYFWRSENIFQCLPIFAMAFGCQTQMFLLYDNLPDPSLGALNSITRKGACLCMSAYLLTGFFGYIAFYKSKAGIEGDMLLSFPATFFSEVLKMGFVISVALSFPLMVFPCRASLNTLMFAQNQPSHGHGGFIGPPPMSDRRFNMLTFMIIIGTLLIAIQFPDVEFILGLNGSTMGCMISFIFPALLYLRVMESKQDGKMVARIVLIVGILVLCVSTYTTLQAQHKEHANDAAVDANSFEDLTLPPELRDSAEGAVKNQDDKGDDDGAIAEKKEPPDDINKEVKDKVAEPEDSNESRQEPPIPHPPDDHEEPAKEADVAPASNENKGTLDDKDNAPEKLEKRDVQLEVPKAETKSAKKSAGTTKPSKNVEDVEHKAVEAERHEEIKQLLEKMEVQQNIQQDLIEQNKVLMEEIKEVKKQQVDSQKGVEDESNKLADEKQADHEVVQNQAPQQVQQQQQQQQQQFQKVPQQPQNIQQQPLVQQQNIPQQHIQPQPVVQQNVQQPVMQQQPMLHQQNVQQQAVVPQQNIQQQQQPEVKQQPIVQQNMPQQPVVQQQNLQQQPINQQNIQQQPIQQQQNLQQQQIVQRQNPQQQPVIQQQNFQQQQPMQQQQNLQQPAMQQNIQQPVAHVQQPVVQYTNQQPVMQQNFQPQPVVQQQNVQQQHQAVPQNIQQHQAVPNQIIPQKQNIPNAEATYLQDTEQKVPNAPKFNDEDNIKHEEHNHEIKQSKPPLQSESHKEHREKRAFESTSKPPKKQGNDESLKADDPPANETAIENSNEKKNRESHEEENFKSVEVQEKSAEEREEINSKKDET